MPYSLRRRPQVTEHLFIILVAIGCGLAGASGAVLFRFLIQFFQESFFGSAAFWQGLMQGQLVFGELDPLALGEDLPAWRRMIAPMIGGLFVGPIVYYFAREAKGHGVPEVMEAVALRGGVIRPRVVAVKTVASALTIASGGSVGREGPIVQIGSALGSTIGQVLRLPTRQIRTLVGCGAASGIAATFNAPIAGALFAVEVILGDFAVAQFTPIVISSVVATVVSRYFLGNTPAFDVPSYELVSPFELGPYMLVGVFAALVGVVFMTVLHYSEDAFDRLPIPGPLKAAVGGLLVGLIGISLPHVFGVGYGSISAALEGDLPLYLLGALLVAKVMATSITIGSGGSGGVFAPSLFLGAMTGGVFGTLIHDWFPESTATSGAYALVTMGAVVAATTHAPITAIIMIFEMTQSITIIPPLMAACVISTIGSGLLRRDSIYTSKLVRRGVDLLAERDPNVLKGLTVREEMDREPVLLDASASFSDVLDLVVRSPHSDFFVVDREGRLLGAIAVSALRRIIYDQDALRNLIVAADLVESRPTVTEEDDLDTVMQQLTAADSSELAVVAEDDPSRVVGAISQEAVREAYNREMLERDMAGGVSSRVEIAGRGSIVDLGGDYVLAEVEAPDSLGGKTLREIDLRAKTGIQVVLVRSAESAHAGIRVPAADDRLEAGDQLVVAGREDAVKKLRATWPRIL